MASDEQQTQVERELTLYRQTLDGRDDMIRRALAAGITKNRIHVLTGIARTTIDRVVNSKENPVLDNEEVCGETYDHDEEIDYDGPDGRQWSCRRCGAEGWESRDPDTTTPKES